MRGDTSLSTQIIKQKLTAAKYTKWIAQTLFKYDWQNTWIKQVKLWYNPLIFDYTKVRKFNITVNIFFINHERWLYTHKWLISAGNGSNPKVFLFFFQQNRAYLSILAVGHT